MAKKDKGGDARRQRLKALKRRQREQKRHARLQEKQRNAGTAASPVDISREALEAAYVDPSGLKAAQKQGPVAEGVALEQRPHRPSVRQILAAAARERRRDKAPRASGESATRNRRAEKWRTAFNLWLKETNTPESARSVEGMRWENYQRQRHAAGKLAGWQVDLLEQAGFCWQKPSATQQAWYRRMDEIKALVTVEAGTVDLRQLSGKTALKLWLGRQHKRYLQGKLSKDQAKALQGIGFDPRRGYRDNLKYNDWEQHFLAYRALLDAHSGRVLYTQSAHKHLPRWVARQRELYARGELDPQQRERLQQIGFAWTAAAEAERNWRDGLRRLREFRLQYGHTQVPRHYPPDPGLGLWVADQRKQLRDDGLSKVQAEELARLGFSSHARKVPVNRWHAMYRSLVEYCNRHCGGKIPRQMQLPEELHRWLFWQRRKYRQGKLAEWQITNLEQLAIYWDVAEVRDAKWRRSLDKLVAFKSVHGHTRVPVGHADNSLALWVQNQRDKFSRGELPKSREDALRAIGFEFDTRTGPRPAWLRHYRALESFFDNHGHSRVPRQYPPNQGLAEWVAQQKQRGKQGKLRDFHIAMLDKLNFPWTQKPHAG